MSGSFPKNPEHNTIFEPEPGVFYIYDLPTRSWVRTEGGIPGLATPLAAGLMSSSDLYKLNRIIVPPPQTTLRAEDCVGTLTGGIIEFKVGDQFLTIEGTAKLMNEVAGIDSGDAQIVTRELHQHTNSFDFRVDTDIFYDYMESSGKFRIITTRGRKGPPGEPGLPGDDDLPHGPKGPQGDAGTNAPFDVGLEVDPISLEKKSASRRAIIGFDVENISEDENYLVAYRATIGNPNACPADIRLTSALSSTWAVCTPSSPTDSQIGTDECFVCTGELYYLDLAILLESIENEFDRQVQTLKEGMEDIVTFWFRVMSGVYDEQKAALCCALEYCRSQSRNQETRRYIEQSRIQAAQSDHSIVIEGDPDEHTKAVTIMEPSCNPGGFGTDNAHGLPNNQDPIGGSQCVPWIMYDDNGKPIKYPQCPAGFTPRDVYREYITSAHSTETATSQALLDRQIAELLAQPIGPPEPVLSVRDMFIEKPTVVREQLPPPTALTLEVLPDGGVATGELAAGEYLVSVDGLVAIDDQFTAGVVIKYNSTDGERVASIPDILSRDDAELARAYRSVFVQINHTGGRVRASCSAPTYATGKLKVAFSTGKKAKAKKDEAMKAVKMPPGKPGFPERMAAESGYCEISSDYLRWYEKCWKIRKCSGAIVNLAGQDFVIIYRQDSKITCGDAAIACPTLDGENFVPSTGMVNYERMTKLEAKVHELLQSGTYKSKVGNLKDIKKIFFPTA